MQLPCVDYSRWSNAEPGSYCLVLRMHRACRHAAQLQWIGHLGATSLEKKSGLRTAFRLFQQASRYLQGTLVVIRWILHLCKTACQRPFHGPQEATGWSTVCRNGCGRVEPYYRGDRYSESSSSTALESGKEIGAAGIKRSRVRLLTHGNHGEISDSKQRYPGYR